jgi:hypothetical protein
MLSTNKTTGLAHKLEDIVYTKDLAVEEVRSLFKEAKTIIPK